MAVLHTETKTIPAQTIEITVIGVPVHEWKRMQWKTGISTLFACACIFGVLIFYWSGMPGVENTASFAHVVFGLDILHNKDDNALWRLIMLTISLSTVLLCAAASDNITRAEDALLQKHGWDGISPKRVELEYPQHFQLD